LKFELSHISSPAHRTLFQGDLIADSSNPPKVSNRIFGRHPLVVIVNLTFEGEHIFRY
jgi:hypothetical protein